MLAVRAALHGDPSFLGGVQVHERYAGARRTECIDERRDVIAAFLACELELLYVSPERAALDSFKRMLARVPVVI